MADRVIIADVRRGQVVDGFDHGEASSCQPPFASAGGLSVGGWPLTADGG
jgi:hypothetical protein